MSIETHIIFSKVDKHKVERIYFGFYLYTSLSAEGKIEHFIKRWFAIDFEKIYIKSIDSLFDFYYIMCCSAWCLAYKGHLMAKLSPCALLLSSTWGRWGRQRPRSSLSMRVMGKEASNLCKYTQKYWTTGNLTLVKYLGLLSCTLTDTNSTLV